MSDLTGFHGLRLPDWLQNILLAVRLHLREVVIISCALNVLAIATPIFVLQVYDRVIFHNGLATLAGLSLGMLLVLMGDYLFRIVRSRILQRVALEVDIALTQQLSQHFLHLPLSELEARPTPHWQRVFRDVEVVRGMLSGGVASLISDLPFIVLFLGLIAMIGASVLWVVLVFTAAFTLLAWGSNRLMQRRLEDERQSARQQDTLLAETIAGRATLKALNLAPYICPILEQTQAEHIENGLKRGLLNDRMAAVAHVLSMGSTVAIISFGALAILEQNLTMGGLIAANMLASRLLQPLNQLIGTWRLWSGFRGAISRLDTVFALPQERQQTSLSLASPQGQLDLQNVSYTYTSGTHPILKTISLAIRPGGMTAVIGPNGSGKTTLLKVLLGLYTPAEGRTLFDKADMTQFSRDDLSRWIGYVPQDTFLLSGSIRSNIMSTRPEASDDALRTASERAGLDAFVRRLPNGYDTNVGEAGHLMSGGIRQRIGLARAFLLNPPVLLLDEPTSNLDQAAESHLRQVLLEYAQSHTVVVVSHSPALLTSCRDIIVLPGDGSCRMEAAADVLRAMKHRGTKMPPTSPLPESSHA